MSYIMDICCFSGQQPFLEIDDESDNKTSNEVTEENSDDNKEKFDFDDLFAQPKDIEQNGLNQQRNKITL